MPRRRTSIKRTRADRKKQQHNLKIKKQLKKTIKSFQTLLSAKNVNDAKKFIGKVFSQLDKAAKKSILHPKTARRKKSRLSKRLNKHR